MDYNWLHHFSATASPRHILRVPGYGLLWQGAPVLVAIEGEEKEAMKGLAEPKNMEVSINWGTPKWMVSKKESN